MAMQNYINPYNPYMANFMQNRMESLQRQRADIDNQISMMNQQMGQQPPIQQTFITNPQPQEQQGMQFDFKGKWVASEQEARSISNNIPLLLLDENDSKFYMKDAQGGLRAFKFEEIFETDSKENQNEEIQLLKQQLAQQNQAIQAILATLQSQPIKNTPTEQKPSEHAEMPKKQVSKKQPTVKEGNDNA